MARDPRPGGERGARVPGPGWGGRGTAGRWRSGGAEPARPLTWAAPARTRRGLRRGGRPEPTQQLPPPPPGPAVRAAGPGCPVPGLQVCGVRDARATCTQVSGARAVCGHQPSLARGGDLLGHGPGGSAEAVGQETQGSLSAPLRDLTPVQATPTWHLDTCSPGSQPRVGQRELNPWAPH